METDSRFSWIRLALTLAVAAVINSGIWIIILVMPDIQAEFGISRGGASLAYTATMVGFALGNLLIGRLVDRAGITVALIGAVALYALAHVAAALAPSMALVSIAQAAIGLGTAVGFGPVMADISHWFRRWRGVAVAVVGAGNYVSGALWPMLLSGVLAEQGWRAVYLAMAAIAVVLVVPLALGLRRRVRAETYATANADVAARAGRMPFNPRQLQMMLAFAGLGCCVAMSMPQVNIVALCADLGFGPAVGAEMLALMLMGGAVSRLASGFLFDRFGGLVTVLAGSALQCLALFLYLPAGGLVSLYIVSLVFGLSQGGIVPGYTVIVREYLPAQEAGARVGVVMMMTILGMALGGWMSGWIYDQTGSYALAFWNGILWNFANLAILGTLFRATRRRRFAVA